MKKSPLEALTDTALGQRYEADALENESALNAADSRRANRAFDRAGKVLKEVGRRGRVAEVLGPLMSSTVATARLWAATALLFDDGLSLDAQRLIASMIDNPPLGADAWATMEMWKSGELKNPFV